MPHICPQEGQCHRGSAKEESRWRRILEYFSSATQIGMTATPKETKYISNLSYFGEPVYTYSLKEGIEDGFLAPFKVINIITDIGDGWRPRKESAMEKDKEMVCLDFIKLSNRMAGALQLLLMAHL